MGTLYYGASRLEVKVDDRMLAHLRVVTTAKLRRDESFTVTCVDPDDPLAATHALWMHRDLDLRFLLDGPPPPLDNALLGSMSAAAYVARGIELPARLVES